MKPVAIRANPAALTEVKSSLNQSSSKNPSRAVGMQAMTIIIRSRKKGSSRQALAGWNQTGEKKTLANPASSRLTNMAVAQRVPRWTMMLNKTCCCDSLHKPWAMTRWPEELTGRNSVRPWISPSRKASTRPTGKDSGPAGKRTGQQSDPVRIGPGKPDIHSGRRSGFG